MLTPRPFLAILKQPTAGAHIGSPAARDAERATAPTSESVQRPRAWWLDAAAVAAILGLATALRLWRLDVTVYEIDEAAVLRLAEDLVRLGRVPLSGPVFSAGIPSAPHFIYLLAPVVALSRDPAFVSGAIALANVAGLGATMLFAWRAFGRTAALIGGLLYAVSPYAVFYARRIWQPDLLPPLAALLLVALELGVVQRRVWWAAASIPLAALATLVHPSFLPLALLLILPILVLVQSHTWMPLLIGATIAALFSVPTVVHEVQTRWVDVANIRYYTSLHTWINSDSLQYAVALATGFAAPVDPAVPPVQRVVPDWLAQGAAAPELVLLIASLLIGLGMLLRNRARARVRLGVVLAAACIPVILTVRHSLPLQAHYFLASAPALFVLLGIGASWLVRRGLFIRVVVVAAMLAIVAVQGAWVVGGLRYVGAVDDACYGPQLRTARTVEDTAVDFGAGATRAVVELAADDALPIGYLLRDDFAALDVSGVGAFGLGAAVRPDAPGPATTLFSHVDQRSIELGNGFTVDSIASSAQLSREQRFAFALTWHVDAAADSKHPHVWRVSLLDGGGATVFELSGVDHMPADLRGQRVLSWFSVDPALDQQRVLPEGEYRVVARLVDTWVPRTVGPEIEVASIGMGAPRRCAPG